MRIEPEIGGASIVLLGSFNPKIFQPYWMAKHGLISDSAAEALRIGHGRTGIYMEVNDHYELTESSQTSTPEAMMALLVKVFDKSMGRSEGIIDQIMSLKQ